MLRIIPGILISYLIGSIPTAYLFAKALKGVDIRTQGSGNVGATNASRVLGKKLGLLVLLLDIAKGAIAVVLVGNAFAPAATQAFNEAALSTLLGFSCIIGHSWTIFLGFKGGKGVATTLGVLSGLAAQVAELRVVLAAVLLAWLLIFILYKVVSIASIAAAVTLPASIACFTDNKPLLVIGVLIACVVILRHSSNIKRLTQGKEPRFSFKKTPSQK